MLQKKDLMLIFPLTNHKNKIFLIGFWFCITENFILLKYNKKKQKSL